MQCLLYQDQCLNDNVIGAYMCCMRSQAHLQHRDGGKVYLMNTFISGMLKQDGKLKVPVRVLSDRLLERAENYLEHYMVFIPINIKNRHWYLAVLNA